MRILRPLAMAAVAGLALFGVGACSEDSAGKDAADSSGAATTSTSQRAPEPAASTSASESDSSASGGGESVDADAFMKKIIDRMPDSFAISDGKGRTEYMVDGKIVKTKMTSTSSGTPYELITIGTKSYSRLGAGKWSLYDAAEAEGTGAASDPVTSLESVRQAVRSVRKTGRTETIRGQKAEAYDVVVDLSAMGGGQGETGTPGATAGQDASYVYWIDGTGRLARLQFETGLADSMVTVEYFDWGKKFHIEAPPTDQVTPGTPFGSVG